MNTDEHTSGIERLLWKKAPVPTLRCLPDGKCLDANDAAVDFFGMDLETIKQSHIGSLAASSEEKPLKAFLEEAALKNIDQHPLAVSFQCGNASVRHALLTVRAIDFNHDTSGVNSDLVIQILPQSSEPRSSDFLSGTFLSDAHDAIIMLDPAGLVQYWNPGATRMFGWEEQELLGQRINQYAFAETPDIDKLFETLPQKGQWFGELGAQCKSGKPKTIEARFNLLSCKTGEEKRILGIISDVTEKRALEECYVRSQRLESLSTLAAGVAHDLNNVFTPITMAVELLRSVELPKEELEDLLATVDTSIQRGADIIKQLVAFGKGAEGQSIVFQPKHIVREVISIAQKTFPQGIEVRSDVLREQWVIRGDQIQFHQMLMNLLLNARDAMPEGGRIDVRTNNVNIDEHYPSSDLNPGRYIKITIEDNGEGMDEAVREKIFEPFFTTRPVGKGAGLGLTNVLGIVKSFDGFVQCESEKGQGARFHVFIPAVIEKKPDEPVYSPSEQQGHGETVLIVDDEGAVRDTTQKLLNQNGYKTLKAVDGVDAVSVYGRNQDQIKVVVTDLKMPNMDGISLVRILRNMNPDLPILVVSGHPDEHDLEVLKPCSSIHLLEKPHKSQDLLHWVHHLLHHKELLA